jgi:hypothetical protein
MINIDIKERENIFVLTPDGAIGADDIAAVNEQVNTYINTCDRIPNLVVRASSLPHWKDFQALAAHFKFIKNHHKVVKKVAIVSDSSLIWLIRPIVNQFTGAKVRRFPERAFDDAVNWAEMEEDHPGEFLLIEGLPDDVIGIDARGLITSVDYEEMLVPLVETKLQTHDKLKVLLVAGQYFDGFSGGAMWDDARLGLSHFTTFSKMALVTDVQWLRNAAKFFGPFLPTEVSVFNLDELDDAKVWITT